MQDMADELGWYSPGSHIEGSVAGKTEMKKPGGDRRQDMLE